MSKIISRENRIVFENAPELEFRQLAEELSAMFEKHGVSTRPYKSAALPIFSSLSSEGRVNALGELRQYVQLCRAIMAEGGTLFSSQTFTWRALREMKIVPPSDLFSKMSESDIVEIHDMNHIGRFRNLNFFKLCSYTLEELYSIPWNVLFTRLEENVTEKLIEMFEGLIRKNERGVVSLEIGTQHIHEVSSSERFTFKADVKHVAMLYGRDDKLAGYIAIESAELVSRGV